MKILNAFAGIGGNRYYWDELGDFDITAIDNHPLILEEYQRLFPNDTTILGDAWEYIVNNFNKFDFIWASPPCVTHSRVGFLSKKRLPDMRFYGLIVYLRTVFPGNKPYNISKKSIDKDNSAFLDPQGESISSNRSRKTKSPTKFTWKEQRCKKFPGKINTPKKFYWIIENVKPFYSPLIKGIRIGHHYFWSNTKLKHRIAVPKLEGGLLNSSKDYSKYRRKLEKYFGFKIHTNIRINNNHDYCQIYRNCVHPKIGKYLLNQILRKMTLNDA